MPEITIDFAAPGALARFQQAFTAHVRDAAGSPAPGALPPARMALYRELVFGNVERVMGNMFPVLKSLLAPDAWDALTRAFFRDHALHDPLFQSMPREFVDYLAARPPAPDDPPWLLELAHYEWVDYALSIAPDETPPAALDPGGDLLAGRPRPTALLWMLNYAWPVQHFRGEALPVAAPDTPTYLAAWRDGEDRVRFLELAPSAARLLEMLGEDTAGSGLEALQALAAEMGVDCDAAFIAAGRETLEAWRAAGIIVAAQKAGAAARA